MFVAVRRGEIWLTALDPVVGCELRKCRPAIVVSADPANLCSACGIVVIVPLKSIPNDARPRPHEVVIDGGVSGLSNASVTVLNQIRAIDRQRLRRFIGHVSIAALSDIERGLRKVLGFDASSPSMSAGIRT